MKKTTKIISAILNASEKSTSLNKFFAISLNTISALASNANTTINTGIVIAIPISTYRYLLFFFSNLFLQYHFKSMNGFPNSPIDIMHTFIIEPRYFSRFHCLVSYKAPSTMLIVSKNTPNLLKKIIRQSSVQKVEMDSSTMLTM